MAYTPKIWVTGETIEAADLNHMEQGIAAISANGAIDTDNLANASVTNDKIAQGAVANDNIANEAVGTTELQNGAVTEAKINASVAITNAQIDALFA